MGTMAGHRLRVYLRKDIYVGPIGLQDSRLRPGGYEDVSGRIAVWVGMELMEVQLVGVCMLSAHGGGKCAC